MAKGYTKISNKMFDFLCSDALDHSELKVMLFIIRYTIGFHRDTTRASISYIARGTCLCENTTRKALKGLIKKGYVAIEYEHKGPSAQILKLILQNIEGITPQTLSSNTTKDCTSNTTKDCTQDIKEYIKEEDIKNNKKASPQNLTSFLPCETSLMREMSDEDRARYLALLPKELLERDPDDYTDEEWDIYDDWRVSNGLI